MASVNKNKIQVGNNHTEVHTDNESNCNQCIADLQLTDPRDDKARIEQIKGGLLKDSYKWILDDKDFQQWRDDRDSKLLWIKGDAGKGKTMLLCGIIDELSQPRAEMANARKGGLFCGIASKMSRRFKKSSPSPTYPRAVSFFFCQGTDSRLNRAAAVLRGLLYILLSQQLSLTEHIQSKYDYTGRRLFEDTNTFYTLSQALLSMLHDPRAKGCYMIIDALDECEQDLPQLLDIIVQSTSDFVDVKWIVSSRNRPDIEQQLHRAASKTRLSLELDAHHVAEAVNTYIDHKVVHLVSLNGNKSLQDQVRHEMRLKADKTFLWAALVAQELQKVQSWDVLSVLRQMPSGLTPLCERIMRAIQQLQPEGSELCRLIISAATVAYRPLRLCELAILSGLPQNVSDELQSVVDICAPFLTIWGDYIYLIHQSVKDFLTSKESNAVFQRGFAAVNHTMFLKSIQIMSDTLRRDMYDLRHPGASIDNIRQPRPDPLALVRYSCLYWVSHLRDTISPETSRTIDDLHDDGTVHQFLSQKCLYWFEALALLRSIPEGVVAMTELEILLDESDKCHLLDLVRDARRLVLSHGSAIGNAPLQAYASALIFSSGQSITRRLFEREVPNWIVTKPAIAEDWDADMATMKGHREMVYLMAFSPDGQRLISTSYGTVKIWDTTTGHYQGTLRGHGGLVISAAFSLDGKCLASGSEDGTIKIWDISGRCMTTISGHRFGAHLLAFSSDSQRLASASHNGTVKIWDIAMGHCLVTLKGHRHAIWSMAFSPDGQRFTSASRDWDIKVWDATTGHAIATLEGYGGFIGSVASSSDRQLLTSTSCGNKTIKIWDTTTGHSQATLEGHDYRARLVAFSPDGQRLASALYETIMIWDAITGQCQATLEGHVFCVNSVAFSPDGQRLASASEDKTVKIWDITTGHCQATLDGHMDVVLSVAFSPDGQHLASVSLGDETVKIWDPMTGHCQATLGGHSEWVGSVAFSSDSQRLASASLSPTIKIWDATTGHCQATLEGHGDFVCIVAFSPDGQRLASASWDETVKIWDAMTGYYQMTLHVGRRLTTIRFDETSARLLTDAGTFDLNMPLSSTTAGLPTTGLHHPSQSQGYGISADGTWITYQGRNLLWLPSEYRPRTSAIRGSIVALGCNSGRVLLFRFSETATYEGGRY